ncbi:MAG: DinB family protein [Thermomicrobiales bacterium]
MLPIALAVEASLASLVADAFRQVEGVPGDDLNTWLPALGLEDINTFAALLTHLLGAGEYWTLEAVGGHDLGRDRDAEFRTHTTVHDLRTRADRWLSAVRELVGGLTEADLARVPTLNRGFSPTSGAAGTRSGWTVADCLTHAVDHTATHLGHLQIQRQMWNAERGAVG